MALSPQSLSNLFDSETHAARRAAFLGEKFFRWPWASLEAGALALLTFSLSSAPQGVLIPYHLSHTRLPAPTVLRNRIECSYCSCVA